MRGLSRTALCALVALALLAGAGCTGGGGKSPTLSASTITQVSGSQAGTGANSLATGTGNQACLQCHAITPSDYYSSGDSVDRASYPKAGQGIGQAFEASVHSSPPDAPSTTDYVACTDCHGDASRHFGLGPIGNWAPQEAQCTNCHNASATMTPFDVASFDTTAHANGDDTPDEYFFQGSAGSAQATDRGQLLFQADGAPVTKTQRIEECSVCHNYEIAARPAHITSGLTQPRVDCQSCHDAHQPALSKLPDLSTRTAAQTNPVLMLRPMMVNNDPSQTGFGAKNSLGGTWIRPAVDLIYAVAGQTENPGYAKQGTQGDWLRLSSARLCAGCHTRGTYKFTAFEGTTPVTATHNLGVYTQYLQSGHADKTAAAFEEFSLLAPVGSSHRPQYPVDMGLTDGRINGGANNYACDECHQGIAAIDYLKGVQGGVQFGDSNKAHVLYGDSTVTCITCHNPHKPGNGMNVRVPKYLSYNTWFDSANNPGAGNVRGGLNRMMDGTPIPSGAAYKPDLICLACHQGRQSGYTVYRTLEAAGTDPYDLSGTYTGSYIDAHHASSGAELWGKNSFEFTFGGTPQVYSDGIPQHQQENCVGCHMSDVDPNLGGHTMKPSILTCQQCHATVSNFLSVPVAQDVDGDPTTDTVYESFGTIDASSTPSQTDKGLLNILRYALYSQGILYDPSRYPYFFERTDTTTPVTHWTVAQIEAAFNLGKLYQEGNAVYVHNFYYSSQILIDSLRALGVVRNPATGLAFQRPVKPASGSTHQATDYRTISIP